MPTVPTPEPHSELASEPERRGVAAVIAEVFDKYGCHLAITDFPTDVAGGQPPVRSLHVARGDVCAVLVHKGLDPVEIVVRAFCELLHFHEPDISAQLPSIETILDKLGAR